MAKSLQNEDVVRKIAAFCSQAKDKINELSEQFKKMKTFHEEQLKAGAVDYAGGKSRVGALDNLQVLEKALDEAKRGIDEVLQQLPQVTAVKKANITQGLGGTSTEEEEQK